MVSIKGFSGLSKPGTSGGVGSRSKGLSRINIADANSGITTSASRLNNNASSSELKAATRQGLGRLDSVGAGVTALRDIITRIQSLNTRLDSGTNVGSEVTAVRNEITALTNEYNSIVQAGGNYHASSDLSAFTNQIQALSSSSAAAAMDLTAANSSLVNLNASITATNSSLAPAMSLIDDLSSSLSDNSLAMESLEMAMGDLPSALSSFSDAIENNLLLAEELGGSVDGLYALSLEYSESAMSFVAPRDIWAEDILSFSSSHPVVVSTMIAYNSSLSALVSLGLDYNQASLSSMEIQDSYTYYEDLYITSGLSSYSEEYSSYSLALPSISNAMGSIQAAFNSLSMTIDSSFSSFSDSSFASSFSSLLPQYDSMSSLWAMYDGLVNGYSNAADAASNMAAAYTYSSIYLIPIENDFIGSSISSLNEEIGGLADESLSLLGNDEAYSSSITSLTSSLTVLADLSSESTRVEQRIVGYAGAISNFTAEIGELSAASSTASWEATQSSSSQNLTPLASGLREVSIQDGLKLPTYNSALRKVSAEILSNRLHTLQVGSDRLGGESQGLALNDKRNAIEEKALRANESSLSSTEVDAFSKSLAGSIVDRQKEAILAIGSLTAGAVENLIGTLKNEGNRK